MRLSASLAGLLLSGALYAAPTPAPVELQLLAEHPVEGLDGSNLSGLARCGDEWLAVSDRADDRLYRLQAQVDSWQAVAERFSPPEAPPSGLPWGLRMRSWAINQLRGGALDFEGIDCDSAGNRYLLSETQAAVLQLGPSGNADWLKLPTSLVRQARASGMLLSFNALLEGIAIDAKGERLWLAAERERRGLLVLHKRNGGWHCTGGCVLLSEGGLQTSLAQPDSGKQVPLDFADLHYFNDRLFSLERAGHRICRRNPSSGASEKCWSFAAAALSAPRRYASPYGVAEALWLDQDGAWIGLDNGGKARADGESRPLLWHLQAPADGWSAP